jgi:hypothetical protein
MQKTKTKKNAAKAKGDTKSTSNNKPTAKAKKPVGTAAKAQAAPVLSVFTPKKLRKFVRWLTKRHAAQGGVTEIRAIADRPNKAVWSAYVKPDDVENIVATIQPVERPKIPYGEHPRDGEATFYFTLNTVKPALYARSAGTFNRCEATADADVVAYSLFPIDIDAVRPAGISATDDEKKAARKVANKIRDWLVTKGITPLVADSGNGAHLLIPTVPYQDVPATSAKAHQLLKILDKKFSTDRAKVDTTVANPARIFKLYGTKSVKGSDVPDRPHRYADIDVSDVPPDIDLFEILKDELKEVPASEGTSKSSTAKSAKGGSAPAAIEGGDFSTSVCWLKGVLDRSGLEFKEVAKDGTQGRLFTFKACPHHKDPDGHEYECSVMVKPDGKFAANCFHDDAAGWFEFKSLIGWHEHAAAVKAELGLVTEYKATDRGIVWMKPTKDGPVPTPLTNYKARILRTCVEDDGEERRSVLQVEVHLNGRSQVVNVPAKDFNSMNWVVEHFGAGAIISPGEGVRERTRHAIQVLSGHIPVEIAYAHTGWAEIAGKMVYLHAGGAIGSDGSVPDVRVSLGGPFSKFVFPNPPNGVELKKAVRTSWKLLFAAPPEVAAPLFAGVYRAPLGAADFSLFFSGPTGNFKTAFACLGQQHWGRELDFRHVPANWSSTANANEGMAHQSKDALLLMDDFAPGSSAQDTVRLHRDADRIFRNAGNGTGRARMKADSALRATKYPRGLIIATGEDVPKGQSVRARLLVIEISPGTIDTDKLTACQSAAAKGLYAAAMAAYVRWLAGRYDQVKTTKAARVAELRDEAADSTQHKRTPGIVAELYYAAELFCEFAVEVGAITKDQVEQATDLIWKGLGKAAAAQAVIQANGEPVQRFFDLLTAAVASGKAHIAAPDGTAPPNAGGWGWRITDSSPQPQGDRVGWVDGNDLYLEPEASFTAAQRMSGDGREALAVTSHTLHKRLKEKDKLVTVDKKRGRLTIRKTIGGMGRTVLHLKAEALGLATTSGNGS